MTGSDRIWIDRHGGNWSPVHGGTQDIEYVRRDPAVLAALPEVQALIAAAEARGMVKGLRGAAAIAWALEDGDRWTRSAAQIAILARAAEIEGDAK